MIKQKTKKLPLTSDIVFKRVFSREGSEDILKSLLEAILEIPIKEVVVKNPELPRNLYDSKAGVLDVKVEIDKDIMCDIEMQVKDLKNIDKRSTYYMSRIVSDGLKKNEDYEKIKNTIVINLLNFEFYKRNSYRSIAHMKFEKTKENEYVDMGYQNEDEIATQDLEMHFIEIPKFVKKNPEAKTKLEQWLYLIAGREEKLEMAKKENTELRKAMEIIDELSMDEKEWELYESRRLAIMDYNSGIRGARDEGFKSGLEQGLEQAKNKQIEIAQKLLKLGVNIEDIKEATGLNMDEKEWELYESRRLAIMDYNTGIHAAKEEGIKQGLEQLKNKQIEIAKKLLAKNLPIDEIAEITELDKEELRKINAIQ